jgi:hypothetical protein
MVWSRLRLRVSEGPHFDDGTRLTILLYFPGARLPLQGREEQRCFAAVRVLLIPAAIY